MSSFCPLGPVKRSPASPDDLYVHPAGRPIEYPCCPRYVVAAPASPVPPPAASEELPGAAPPPVPVEPGRLRRSRPSRWTRWRSRRCGCRPRRPSWSRRWGALRHGPVAAGALGALAALVVAEGEGEHGADHGEHHDQRDDHQRAARHHVGDRGAWRGPRGEVRRGHHGPARTAGLRWPRRRRARLLPSPRRGSRRSRTARRRRRRVRVRVAAPDAEAEVEADVEVPDLVRAAPAAPPPPRPCARNAALRAASPRPPRRAWRRCPACRAARAAARRGWRRPAVRRRPRRRAR